MLWLWRSRRQSQNIEVRRGVRVSRLGHSSKDSGLLRLLLAVYRLLGFKGTMLVVVGIIAYGLYSANHTQLLGVNVQGNAAWVTLLGLLHYARNWTSCSKLTEYFQSQTT